MSSLTVDELKRSLTEQGVPLPPAGSKKAEYVRLYEQNALHNDSLDTFSDEEGGSQKISSSTSGNVEALHKEVQQLSNDELYTKLTEFGLKSGPVLENTRRVYEKRLVQFLTPGWHSNGLDNSNKDSNEFSDNEVEIIASRKVEHKKRASSERRNSPKLSSKDTSEQSSNNNSSLEFSSKGSLKAYPSEVKPSKISFIETIPKGSSQRYFERTPDVDSHSSSTFRSRFTAEKTSLTGGDYYRGTWEPSISRYSLGANYLPTESKAKPSNWKIYFAIVVVTLLLLLGAYVFYQWAATDPYKAIADDAAQEIKQFTAQASEQN